MTVKIMALVGGGDLYGLEDGDRRANVYNNFFLFSILQRIYYGFANWNVGSRIGSTYGLRCRSRRGRHNVRKYPFPVLEIRQEVMRLLSYKDLLHSVTVAVNAMTRSTKPSSSLPALFLLCTNYVSQPRTFPQHMMNCSH